MMKRIKILLYGDQNLNIMDGSAIWLTSLANILTYNGNVDLSILLKTPVKRRQVMDNIKQQENITFINPFGVAGRTILKRTPRLEPKEASEVIKKLDKENNYDIIVTRGKDLTSYCLKKKYAYKLIPYITDFNFTKSSNDKEFFKKAYKTSKALFVQTEEMRDYLIDHLHVSGEKFIILPPTVTDIGTEPRFGISNFSIVYTGKFAKMWETEAMLDTFLEVKKDIDMLSLNIAGDKFQADLSSRKGKIADQFDNTSGINWVGAVSRDESMKLIESSDLGFAYRSSEIDNDQSLELSTKFLEYGISGKPVVVRKTKQYVKLLGEDYPLFCNSFDELVEKIKLAFTNEEIFRKAAKRCYQASEKYQITNVSKAIISELNKLIQSKPTILFASHDFKFLNWYIDHCKQSGKYNVLIDKWRNHSAHDERKSISLLQKADIIFCEWGLGNAVFYSNNKLKGQKLYIRIHRQELVTDHLQLVNFNNVTKVIAISTHIYEEFHRVKNIPRNKMMIIPNMVDVNRFNKLKQENVEYHIGLLGYLPRLKRLDRAITIFEELYNHDKRFKLYIKGKHPKDLPWLWKQPIEIIYFKKLFKKIKRSKWRKNVIFESHGDDVAEWFTNINFILSTSDVESFHLAPMEGMASGTIPIVFNWPGAETLYPLENVVKNEKEAVELILNQVENRTDSRHDYEAMVKKYDMGTIISKLDDIIFGE
ncbi:glycosyltransferase involved in cell wall biosynthesis [Pseudogracilibacillus auburnensis]|uniref:Glycosyltransferase involved in cell wall biosynthesis n=2 Tax=Pseudogracilibacillus auburnensis TaxID=1494959 RepID=A0A2V3VY94_9BACI|nr:glycosyltransferase involved in cell wall biosynthesis [Pseudogracilibacillus auburnensis]